MIVSKIHLLQLETSSIQFNGPSVQDDSNWNSKKKKALAGHRDKQLTRVEEAFR